MGKADVERLRAVMERNRHDPSELARRMSRAIEQQKGIRLSEEELDLLVITGAYEKLALSAAEYLKRLSRERLGMKSDEEN